VAQREKLYSLSAVHLPAQAMLLEEGGQVVEELAQLSRIGFVWHRGGKT